MKLNGYKTKKPTIYVVGSNYFIAGLTRLELATSSVTDWRSNQLSYNPILFTFYI